MNMQPSWFGNDRLNDAGSLLQEIHVIDVNYFLRFAATILAGPECL
jgi:hypothetical protein